MRKILALGLSAALTAPGVGWTQAVSTPAAGPDAQAEAAVAVEAEPSPAGPEVPRIDLAPPEIPAAQPAPASPGGQAEGQAAVAGPRLGDPAPPPPKPADEAKAGEAKSPGVAESVGGTVGSVLGSAAGAAGGPLGSAAAGVVGGAVGQKTVGFFKRLFGGGRTKAQIKAAEAAPQAQADPMQPSVAKAPSPAATHAAP